MPAGSTALQCPFTFSYMRRGKAAKVDGAGGGGGEEAKPAEPIHPYENSIKQIAEVSTVEEFWSVYDFLKRPDDLPITTDYHFFRLRIKPTWEDPGNQLGGKCAYLWNSNATAASYG
jgi:Eukaryotic initiation factor 4E